MSRWQLTMRRAPALRLDLRDLKPTALAALSQREVEGLALPHGQETLALGECFEVRPLGEGDADLRLEGELERADGIGWQLDAGRVEVRGSVGHHLGCAMSGGHLSVSGDAGDLAGAEMAGGVLEIGGSVGDFAASTLPGSMDGMRGGTLVVRGHAGARLADRMRRGTVVVFGDVGDFAASRLVAGTLALGGRLGRHPAWGMRRGTLVLAGAHGLDELPPTFVPAGADAAVFWQLQARSLARHGGVFAALPQRSFKRHLGDLAVDGKGELILVD
jgi:formylmethanofuran dehydrogenase subunit C